MRNTVVGIGTLACAAHLALAAPICVGFVDGVRIGGHYIEAEAVRTAGLPFPDWEPPTVVGMDGLSPGSWLILGFHAYNGDAGSLTYHFTPPVTGLEIGSVGSNCAPNGVSGVCETYSVDVNGSHHAFTAGDISPMPRTPRDPVRLELGVTPEGDIQGLFPGDIGVAGSGKVRVAVPSVSTLKVSHTPPGFNGWGGMAFRFCFDAISLQLALKKEASPAPWVAGQPASYTLTLASPNGVATTAETTITDDVPPSLTIGTLPAGCTRAGQVVSCKVPAGFTTSQSFVIPVTPLASAAPQVTNTAKASGGGDAACNGTGACMSTVDTPVALPLAITTTKTASANPLIVGVAGQFYTVAVNVANQPTTAPLAIEDMLPTGITLAGLPELIPGTTTGVLSGCPAAGSLLTGCSVAAGVAPGTFEIRIPVKVEPVAVGPQGGTNMVNLRGGGDPLCTPLIDEACDATTPPTAVRMPAPKVHILKDVISGSGTHRFDFALSGLSVSSDTITVT
ncbi:MAG: hypothetical protein U1B84_14525, partial [Variovorax sp.]|nr:hypothetical protein [Variovorax sp.]